MSEEQLKPLRHEIDGIDSQIIDLLARRIALGTEVAAIKTAENLPIIIPHRVREVIESRAAEGTQSGLSPDFVRDIFNRIIWEMCQQEARTLRDGSDKG